MSTVFRTVCIWMCNNMIEGNSQSLPMPTKNNSYIPACSYSLSKYFFRVSGAAATNLLAAFPSSEQHSSFPKREGINLINEVWQSRAIQCLVLQLRQELQGVWCLPWQGGGQQGRCSSYLHLVVLSWCGSSSGFLHGLVCFCSAVFACGVNSRHLDSKFLVFLYLTRELARLK